MKEIRYIPYIQGVAFIVLGAKRTRSHATLGRLTRCNLLFSRGLSIGKTSDMGYNSPDEN